MSAVIDRHAGARRVALATGDGARPLVHGAAGPVSLATFLGHVRGVAALLPDRPYALNLCEDRYRFLVAFCAAAVRGQVTLLPPARTRAAIDEVRAAHPDSHCIGDGDACGCDLAPLPHFFHLGPDLPSLEGGMPTVDEAATAVIGFTSGSTGRPSPNHKTWRMFRAGTAQNLAALASLWPGDAAPAVVATVPSQHMYGMELSVLLPLLGGAAVHGGRPFFAGDVARALEETPAPRLLVTTPVHLRALVAAGIDLPALAGIVSATAPLPRELAQAAESRFGCEVRETFGSTETCILAARRTACEDAWTPFAGMRLQPQPDGTLVQGPQLDAPVALADLVEIDGDGRFLLRGRRADLLEIAGKRASLADLTRRLLAVPGVEDATVLQLDATDAGGVHRIAALVVAPAVDEATILDALRLAIDPVFLPRPLRRVDALPRNATGKLPRAALLALLEGDAAPPVG